MEIISTKNRFNFERPQIEIGGVLYPIDNRKSTLDKLQKEITKPENEGKEDDALLKLLIGKEGLAAVLKLDLSVSDFQTLIILIQSQVWGITEEEAKKRFLDRL